MNRQEELSAIATRMKGLWKWPPDPEEMAALHEATQSWVSLDPIRLAIEQAVDEGVGERPNVAWLLSRARQSFTATGISAAQVGCRDCDDGWVEAVDGLAQCPWCNPIGAAKHRAYVAEHGRTYETGADPLRARFVEIASQIGGRIPGGEA